MNRDEHGFEPGDRVRVRRAAGSNRVGRAEWEVAGLSERRPGRIALACPTDPDQTMEATRWSLFLVQTVEERMASELMRKRDTPGHAGRREPRSGGRPRRSGAG